MKGYTLYDKHHPCFDDKCDHDACLESLKKALQRIKDLERIIEEMKKKEKDNSKHVIDRF